MANNQAVNIKWLHQSGDYRRFLLEQAPGVDIYELLLQKIRTVVPNFSGSLAWKDEDDDMIVFSSCAEMKEALALPCNQNVFRIYTVEYNKSKEEEKRDAEKKAEESSIPKHVHHGVICDRCDEKIVGIRYKCAVCDDYDLCEQCNLTGHHAEHPMVRYVTPVDRNSADFLHARMNPHARRRRCRQGFRTPFASGAVFSDYIPQNAAHMAASAAMTATDIAAAANEAALAAAQRAANAFVQNMARGNQNQTPHQPQQEQQQQQQQQQEQQQPRQGEQQHQQQHDASQQFRESFVNGIDYLREIGQQVQQALANFGIEVDMDVQHGGRTEHVPRANERANNEHTTTNANEPAKETAEEVSEQQQNKKSTNNDDETNIEKRTAEINQASNEQQDKEGATNKGMVEKRQNDGNVDGNDTASNTTARGINEAICVPMKRMHISDEKTTNEQPTQPQVDGNMDEVGADEADTAILVDIADDDGDTWTMMDNAVVGNKKSSNGDNVRPQIYPNLSDPGIRCMAGTPFIQTPQGPHNPHCPIIHADQRIASCVQQLELMGFDNCNGWLIRLAVENDGDTARVIEALAKDPIYVERLQSAL